MTQCSYTPELADLICTRISEGESLRSICKDPGMPTEGTVRGWALRNHDGFEVKYRQARLLQLDAWADAIVDIADDPSRDPRDRQVRVDTRKWLMSKIAPKRYGWPGSMRSGRGSPISWRSLTLPNAYCPGCRRGKVRTSRRRGARPANANGSATAKPSRRGRVARGRKVTAKAASTLGEATLRAVSALGSEVSAEQVREYLAKQFGMQVQPNHLGRALQRHRVSGRLSESEGRWSRVSV
jgi:hypothetical protein